MQQVFMKKFITAGAILLAVPFTVLAQDKTEAKDKKEKKDFQQIIITREGTTDGKTIIVLNPSMRGIDISFILMPFHLPNSAVAFCSLPSRK